MSWSSGRFQTCRKVICSKQTVLSCSDHTDRQKPAGSSDDPTHSPPRETSPVQSSLIGSVCNKTHNKSPTRKNTRKLKSMWQLKTTKQKSGPLIGQNDTEEEEEEEARREESAKVSAFIKKWKEVKFLHGLKLQSSQRSLDSVMIVMWRWSQVC